MFHILGRDDEDKKEPTRPPVLIIHGLYNDAALWLEMQSQTDAIPWMIQLLEQGYNIWMGNSRGTTFSREHQTLLPPIHSEYWDFTWADMAKYDVPAMINKIKKKTR